VSLERGGKKSQLQETVVTETTTPLTATKTTSPLYTTRITSLHNVQRLLNGKKRFQEMTAVKCNTPLGRSQSRSLLDSDSGSRS